MHGFLCLFSLKDYFTCIPWKLKQIAILRSSDQAALMSLKRSFQKSWRPTYRLLAPQNCMELSLRRRSGQAFGWRTPCGELCPWAASCSAPRNHCDPGGWEVQISWKRLNYCLEWPKVAQQVRFRWAFAHRFSNLLRRGTLDELHFAFANHWFDGRDSDGGAATYGSGDLSVTCIHIIMNIIDQARYPFSTMSLFILKEKQNKQKNKQTHTHTHTRNGRKIRGTTNRYIITLPI